MTGPMTRSMNGPRTPKVLAVDDRPENLLALQAILQGLQVEVVGVGSGDEALKRLLVDDYAVILLDALMPGMDGFETAAHIKRRQRTQHIPIVFLTAMDTDSHLAFRGYQAGAVDYITKPFDPWVLRAKVSVFVDLWTLHVDLADRAAECDGLRAAIEDAAQLLAGAEAAAATDVSAVVEVVARARDRLRAVRAAAMP
jgi:CheY-like chemotaxis protein